MNDVTRFVKVVGGGIASVLTFVFGGADWWLLALLVLVVIDYISGIIAAIIEKKLSSRKGLTGILKKCMFFLVVAVSHIIDHAIGGDGALRSLVIGFLIANEGISILENCGRCGLPVPKKLMDILEQLKSGGNAED